MNVHKQLRVELTLPVDPPHPFIAANKGNPEALAIEVRWERDVTKEGDHTRVVVFAKDGLNRSYWPGDETIPDWVPRPPASWDAIVSDLAAEMLA